MATLFPIIDPHVHLWDLERLSYPWLTPPFGDEGVTGSTEAIARTYLLDDYLADAGDWTVAKIVHVDAGARAEDALDETRWLQAMADKRGYPHGIVAYAALNAPDADEVLAGHRGVAPNLRGIRQILNWHPDPSKTYSARDLLQDPAFERGYALLGRYGLSFDCQIYPGQMPAAAALAGRHPDTLMVLNHAGMPVDRDEAGIEAWRRGMALLAERENVSVKISGLGIVDHAWTTERIRPFVLETIALFGTDRCMFASDFPTDKLFASFDRQMSAFDEITSDFTNGERQALFAANAERIYAL